MSTSKSDLPKKAYHHGDLRSALVEAGLRLLEARTADDLSLREVARAVGVSATAVYRHFPDKGALMAALAGEGLARLAEAQHAEDVRTAVALIILSISAMTASK